jgi:NAD(P)-dependent dehydrogenase (short-subunit alcohol dehydrogenase family)
MSERTVLITGAAGGIGRATALALADRGFRVYAAVRGERQGRDFAQDIRVISLDVTDPDSVATAAGKIAAAEDGGLYALINNAGLIVQGPLELVPPAELHRQFAVNVYGPALVTQAFLPLLRRATGRIINISAPTARVAAPYAGPIGASKAALESLSAAARVELAPWGIQVSVVQPGGTDTPIFMRAAAAAQTALAAADPDRLALYQARLDAVATATARMRTGPPSAVARVIVRAVEARRPRPLYLAGRDARLAAVLAKLPARARDRILTKALNLT